MGDATILRPGCVDDIREAVADAVGTDRHVEVRGGGSKAEIGRPDRATTPLDMGAFAEIVDYDPAELVLTVGAGTPLAEIEALVADREQMLAFDPFDHGPLFGRTAGRATIGGIVAAGVAGSRRVSAGAVRDHLLGFHAVSGRGEAFVAGARVVKNVTGYDLPKLIAGSWGRLAVLTQVTLKVLPRPRAAMTVALSGLSDRDAIAAMTRAMGSQAEVAAAAHVPGDGGGMTALRIEGFLPSVLARRDLLCGLLRDIGVADVLSEDEAVHFWHGVREVAPLAGDRPLWRVVVPPSTGWRVGEALAPHDARWLYDWAGGLVWVTLPNDANPALVHGAATAAGGHAMLVRGDAALRRSASIRPVESPGVAALSRRVKAAFDPAGVLDPDRFEVSRHAH